MLGGFLTIAVTLYMVITSYSSLPFWDGWEEVRFAAKGGSLLSPAWPWRLHNEHPIVIPKLFFAADVRLFQAREAFLLVSILGPGPRILGWARDRRNERLPSTIVVTTNGIIVGLGATGKREGYVQPVNPGLPSNHDVFVAFAPELPPGSTASFYAILRGSSASACYVDRIVK